MLLTTLHNLPEITQISLWDAEDPAKSQANLPVSTKVGLVTSDLAAVLAQPDLVFALEPHVGDLCRPFPPTNPLWCTFMNSSPAKSS